MDCLACSPTHDLSEEGSTPADVETVHPTLHRTEGAGAGEADTWQHARDHTDVSDCVMSESASIQA